MSDIIKELTAKLDAMDPDARAEIDRIIDEKMGDAIWVANAGPQLQAFYSRADWMLYGGAGGGGKTDLIAGLALTQHTRSLIVRPQYTDLGSIIERVVKIAGTTNGLNKSPPAQFKYEGRVIDFGAASDLEHAASWQGNPHSLLAFDEGALFKESVCRYLMGWNRNADDTLGTTTPERVRTIMASNPPLSAAGAWLVKDWGAWLDPAHPNPASAGELRWFVTTPDGDDLEVDGADDIKTWNGSDYTPKSRTFIPAALKDNPFLISTGYQSTLDALPSPLREAIRDGNFMMAREDDAFQVIPTNWVMLANDRWLSEPRGKYAPLDSIGCDVARGGRDNTVLSRRHGHWFDELIVVPGVDTPDGPSVAALVASSLKDQAVCGIDPIGVGADATTSLSNAGLNYEEMNGSESAATSFTRDGSFGFSNKRAEMWWALREALDPNYGYDLALPVDTALMAELTSPTYEIKPGMPPKILIEAKRDISKRLGASASPDRADAVVYAWNSGAATTMVVGRGGATPKKILASPAPQAGYDVLRF